MPYGKLARFTPVCGGATAVEQPGGSECECPRAYRDETRAALGGSLQCVYHRGGRRVVRCITGNHYGIGIFESGYPVVGMDIVPACCRDWTLFESCRDESVVISLVVVTKDFRWDCQVEGDNVRKAEGDDKVHAISMAGYF